MSKTTGLRKDKSLFLMCLQLNNSVFKRFRKSSTNNCAERSYDTSFQRDVSAV